MAKIIPTYSVDYVDYRIPDQITSPTISSKDYFYTPQNKNFIFKTSTQTFSYVNIDFWGFDNSYLVNNRNFTTI